MALFTVDESKCLRDGVCSDVCPGGLIQGGESQLPSPIPEAEKACIHCWHCVMSCPTEAFVHQSMAPSSCVPLSREQNLPFGQLESLYMSRKSTRIFQSRPVSRDIITQLLKLSQLAPSSHNKRNLEWYVIDDKSTIGDLARMASELLRTHFEGGVFDSSPHMSVFIKSWLSRWDNGIDVVLRDAPVVLICHTSSEDAATKTDCSIALTYVELAAAVMGLGTCWTGFFQRAVNSHKPIIDTVGLPEGNTCMGAMILGYPKYQKARLAPTTPLKVGWL